MTGNWIILTRNGQEILVDEQDYEMLSRYRWHVDAGGYAGTSGWDGPYKRERMHRVILGLTKDDDIFVDHINRNRTDNRRENLRLCSNAENVRNRGKRINNTSGYKGVSITKYGVWVAHIRANSKSIYLGRFSTPQEAYMAYCAAAQKLHGEFANFGE